MNQLEDWQRLEDPTYPLMAKVLCDIRFDTKKVVDKWRCETS